MIDPPDSDNRQTEATPTGNTALSQALAQRKELREQFRLARRRLPKAAQTAQATAAAALFARRLPAALPGVVGLFISNDGELDTQPTINHCTTIARPMALPCIRPGKQLVFRAYQAKQRLTAGSYGIPEPDDKAATIPADQMPLLLMPLVAFDDQGNRLGMGGGYYDRYLSQTSSNTRPLLIGLCHHQQHSLEPLPTQSWDIPLDAVLTDLALTCFTTRARTLLQPDHHGSDSPDEQP